MKGTVSKLIKILFYHVRAPVSTVKTLIAEHGTLYKRIGMKPKYTGYIPRK